MNIYVNGYCFSFLNFYLCGKYCSNSLSYLNKGVVVANIFAIKILELQLSVTVVVVMA